MFYISDQFAYSPMTTYQVHLKARYARWRNQRAVKWKFNFKPNQNKESILIANVRTRFKGIAIQRQLTDSSLCRSQFITWTNKLRSFSSIIYTLCYSVVFTEHEKQTHQQHIFVEESNKKKRCIVFIQFDFVKRDLVTRYTQKTIWLNSKQ